MEERKKEKDRNKKERKRKGERNSEGHTASGTSPFAPPSPLMPREKKKKKKKKGKTPSLLSSRGTSTTLLPRCLPTGSLVGATSKFRRGRGSRLINKRPAAERAKEALRKEGREERG